MANMNRAIYSKFTKSIRKSDLLEILQQNIQTQIGNIEIKAMECDDSRCEICVSEQEDKLKLVLLHQGAAAALKLLSKNTKSNTRVEIPEESQIDNALNLYDTMDILVETAESEFPTLRFTPTPYNFKKE